MEAEEIPAADVMAVLFVAVNPPPVVVKLILPDPVVCTVTVFSSSKEGSWLVAWKEISPLAEVIDVPPPAAAEPRT